MQKKKAPEPRKNTESVLFVDDEKHILSSLRRLFKPFKLDCHFANSGVEGLEILEANHIDLIVSDMRMPEMDGATFLKAAKERKPETIRMLLTGYSDMSSTISALNEGEIYRYLSKPWDDEELTTAVMDGLKLRRLEREKQELMELTQQQNSQLQDLNKNLEAKVEERTRQIRVAAKKIEQAHSELHKSYDSFVGVFSSLANVREPLKRSESKAVADLSKRIATALKLNPELVRATYHAALLHQIGKAGLPDELLSKAESEMTPAEQSQYQQYPVVGETVLTAIDGFEKTAILIRHHTELFDGSGYPDHLEGNSVRSGARIIRAVRDFIGLQTGVVSEIKMSGPEAYEEIKSMAGIKYDPIVVKALGHFHDDYNISSMYSNEVKLNPRTVLAGMTLTRDLVNDRGLLLISKGHMLNEALISKLIGLEITEKAEYEIYVEKPSDKASKASKAS